MDVTQFRQLFASDQQLLILLDAVIKEALDEANLITTVSQFGELKDRAAGLYAAHILKVAANSRNGASMHDASSMSLGGQSVSFSRSSAETFYNASIYGQRYLALKNSILTDSGNPNLLTGGGPFVV